MFTLEFISTFTTHVGPLQQCIPFLFCCHFLIHKLYIVAIILKRNQDVHENKIIFTLSTFFLYVELIFLIHICIYIFFYEKSSLNISSKSGLLAKSFHFCCLRKALLSTSEWQCHGIQNSKLVSFSFNLLNISLLSCC